MKTSDFIFWSCLFIHIVLSDDPASWRVSYSDIVSTSRRTGRDHRKKCNNCNIWGHTTQSCPDPQKPIVCLFCGKTGHSRHRCPTTICLRVRKFFNLYIIIIINKMFLIKLCSWTTRTQCQVDTALCINEQTHFSAAMCFGSILLPLNQPRIKIWPVSL